MKKRQGDNGYHEKNTEMDLEQHIVTAEAPVLET